MIEVWEVRPPASVMKPSTFQVQLCGFRRGQIGGDEDDFILNRTQIDDCQTKDVAQQALTDITYVSRTFFQVFIIQLFQAVA